MKNKIFVRKKKLQEKNMLKGMGYGQIAPVFEVVTCNYEGSEVKTVSVPVDKAGMKRDVLVNQHYETHFVERHNAESAKSRASKYGSVMSCQKVDPFYFLHKIEFLNLHQIPMVVEIGNGSIIANNALEIQKPEAKNKFEIVIDKE